jgi:hypothetical protein
MNSRTESMTMELDLQSLFGLHVYVQLYPFAETRNPPPPHLGSFTRALLVSQDTVEDIYFRPSVRGQR